ncbi:UDP-N-acetylmuramoyl-L-alanyl-D-glutamate--2,6-diaminopimelate ligase [Holosporaceae bacterium 'Namur']|nr:UDP-N-acetylmuramoyl-L-alanyl-D-glutamate--2,6-diaminopimelate ligase [Holosporaceae bacterium 'Namur']
MTDLSRATGIAFDSRRVEKGNIYVAIQGEKFNGENFIDEAIEKGATRIIVASSSKITQKPGVTYHFVENPRKELAIVAAEFYQQQPKNIVGVGGTSGKTSTVGFYRQMAEYAGIKAASIGTLGVIYNELEYDSLGTMTSPDPIKLHSVLKDLVRENITHTAIEVSSHGLDQYRLDGVVFKAGGFTNFTQDHLDYHKTLDAYFGAKLRFFSELLPIGSAAVLNKDIKEFEKLKSICNVRNIQVISYGIRDADITFSQSGELLNIVVFGEKFETKFPFNAEFQKYNLACALGLIAASDINIKDAVSAVSSLLPAVGRLEKVGEYRGAQIFIDYAHKPDALEKVLLSARKFTSRKLHILFGCGGDRDQSKRPIMGEIASRLADQVIVTDDNPRNEDAKQIRKEVLSGAQGALEIEGRRAAIRLAIYNLKEGDTLIVAGKGHEDYQIIGDIKYRFSDFEEVKKIIEAPREE